MSLGRNNIVRQIMKMIGLRDWLMKLQMNSLNSQGLIKRVGATTIIHVRLRKFYDAKNSILHQLTMAGQFPLSLIFFSC